jgi:hypothetical protein
MTHDHAVYCYEDEAFLIDEVAAFVKTGLDRNETVIVVATAEHRSDLRDRLLAEDAIGLKDSFADHYVTLDAADTLALFMINGWPDQRLFLQVIGHVIESATQGRPVRIYGEMVAVLWAAGEHQAAIRLEELWNQLAARQQFALLCGYPSSAFEDSNITASFHDVCACHSHVTGATPQLPEPAL